VHLLIGVTTYIEVDVGRNNTIIIGPQGLSSLWPFLHLFEKVVNKSAQLEFMCYVSYMTVTITKEDVMSKLKFRVESGVAGWYAFVLKEDTKRYLRTDGSLQEWAYSNNDTVYFKSRNDVEWAIVNFNSKEEEPTTRPMTAMEISMLPRGTAFIPHENGPMTYGDLYNPSVQTNPKGLLYLDEFYIDDLKGYRKPGETEILPFTVDASVPTICDILNETHGRG